MITRGIMTDHMYGIWLTLSLDGEMDSIGGEITFGGYNPKRFTGPLIWMDVQIMPAFSFKYYWALTLNKLEISLYSSKSFSSNAFAVIDTGNFRIDNIIRQYIYRT